MSEDEEPAGPAPEAQAQGAASPEPETVAPQDTSPATDAPRPCTACRGTGQVTSNLGGHPHVVTCPWCEGGGAFLPGHDAQAARRAEPREGDSQ